VAIIRFANPNAYLRACNKTPTACEPLLFVASFEERDSTCSRQILRNVNEAAASAARRAAANTRVNSKWVVGPFDFRSR